MIEELTTKYEEFKGVIDILPVNTKYNRKRKVDYIMEEINNDTKRLQQVKTEIEKRIRQFDTLKVNDKIEKLENQLEKCNIANEWNLYNTSYEKMHLDYYLYQLHRYYKEDLVSVNACIKKIIESFKKVEIILTKDDFKFNDYAASYMEKILSNVSDQELSTYFEEIYWKNPDIINIIEINFKNIYLKNEKKIDKYYETRHQAFLKNHKDEEIYDMRIKLSAEIKNLNGRDTYLNFQRFVNNEYSVADFKEDDLNKKKEIYFDDGSYNYDNLIEIDKALNEYNVMIKYRELFADMKERLEKKDTLKNSKNNALKEVSKEEDKLIKLNAKRNKKGLFGKPKNDEKWLFEYKEVLNSIINHYNEFDDACFNDLVFLKLTQDSTILEVLKLISSNYLYFVNQAFKKDENANINDVTKQFEDLKDYINNNSFTLLNNIALLDDKPMKQLISDKYNLEHVKISEDALMDENIEKTIGDIETFIKYEDILASWINIDDVSLYLNYTNLLNSEKAHE